MTDQIKKLENCLSAMKKCFKVPHFENCVCFSDAFRALNLEVKELNKNIDKAGAASKGKFLSVKKEIEEITKIISKADKECLGCSPCVAQVVFKEYPGRLNQLYLDSGL